MRASFSRMQRRYICISVFMACSGPISASASLILNDDRFTSRVLATTAASPFSMALNPGGEFGRGLYVSTGLAGSQIFKLTSGGIWSEFSSGFNGVDGIVFGPGGKWGHDLYVAEISGGTVSRVHADGSHEVVAQGFSGPFGPAGIAFGQDGAMYITNFSSNILYRLASPNDSPTQFAVLGPDQTGLRGSAGIKDPKPIPPQWTGPGVGGFFVSAYDSNIADGRPTVSGIQIVDMQGHVTEFVPPTAGLEFGSFGSGGAAFGANYYAANLGNFNVISDGGILSFDPSGNVTTFATGVDGGSLIFDDDGIFGGGMLLADFNAGVIYQIEAVPEPSGWSLLMAAIFSGFLFLRSKTGVVKFTQ